MGSAMQLDPRTCSQLVLSRDACFEGRFSIGVMSTRIYCPPNFPCTVNVENLCLDNEAPLCHVKLN